MGGDDVSYGRTKLVGKYYWQRSPKERWIFYWEIYSRDLFPHFFFVCALNQ